MNLCSGINKKIRVEVLENEIIKIYFYILDNYILENIE